MSPSLTAPASLQAQAWPAADPTLGANSGYIDANTNPANVLLDLQTCSTNFVAGNPAVNSDQDKGYTWTTGGPGIGLLQHHRAPELR